MPTFQITVDDRTSAELAYLAKQNRRREEDLFAELGKQKVSEIFKLAVQRDTNRSVLQLTRVRGPGRRGQPIRYDGHDPRLEHGKTYDSFAHVVRSLGRPELESRLYDPKTRKGDNGESILERYEPEIHQHLVRL